MEFLLPATVVITMEVLFTTIALSVVLSTLFPFASFSSIPKSSINAPLVPEPSSRETTTISLLFSVAQPVKRVPVWLRSIQFFSSFS